MSDNVRTGAEQSEYLSYWDAHPEQAKQLLALCMKCPALYLKDEEREATWKKDEVTGKMVPYKPDDVPDAPFCTACRLHLVYVLPTLLKHDGKTWEHTPEICYQFGYIPKSYQLYGLKKVPGRTEALEDA
jgi:hypothetical protein